MQVLDRRQLLALAGLLSWRLAVPRVGAALEAADMDDLVRSIDMEALRAIGRKYLDQKPSENDLAWLEESLATAGGEPLEISLDRGIRADFREGRMEQIDHWFLSTTECRLCALLSLTERA